ncbi:MAG: type I-F CRISPR-associated helicase Cas3 [gamma proteobacterium endosymbiont of Lamellibrachia anaximandri]|nr:type I-F CRISPR-associated helicase Cas3 [gamma proteobacterium endosymbiont of Lamellibrachia anaximandri]MBL3616717.1 type I-F CRISPR-associated helicase Cas3 [gamma proteobacterium endosymbiont of Lamellibrachia anaximandri]
MNVMLISQCNKNALKETRRILDQFAERRGDRSWQTAITQQGLVTLHRMLRKTARKNTSVACLWIRGKDHSELIWVVGDNRRFNDQGGTPTNTTERDVLRRQDENDWHHAEDIRLLASLAALFHDLGKANQAFQKKLEGSKPIADAYRHEWVSLRLFEAFVGEDDDAAWLKRLAELADSEDNTWQKKLLRDGVDPRTPAPLRKLPPLAKAVGWLILSHHRMPINPDFDAGIKTSILEKLPDSIPATWCGARNKRDDESDDRYAKAKAACWKFTKGTPFNSKHWQQHVSRVALAILKRPPTSETQWLDDPYVMHMSRMALMLADHFYSSEPNHPRYGDAGYPLIANTDRDTGNPKQRLDEHLIGVEVNASRIVRTLPRLEQQMPRIARHKGFRQRSRDKRFHWQDKAFDLAKSLQIRATSQGFFGVNMASTGCGKTLANGRILYALAHPQQGARFNIALGLRALTLQTGDAYRERLGLGAEDMAVLVGGGAIRQLHEHQQKQGKLEQAGSESSESLLAEQNFVHFEGSLEDGPLNKWLKKTPEAQKLLNAPILISTIDHLIPATEGTRGGHQITPMLRLMTSDLILDEPDDFGLEDLPALTRLVHWAGLLGSKVLLSSATLPPALIQGLFQVYREGRRIYQNNRGEPGQPLSICCAWFDEYNATASDYAEDDNFQQAHHRFVEKRLIKLAEAKQRRKAIIHSLSIAQGQTREVVCQDLARSLLEQIPKLHLHHHNQDPKSGKHVSFGLIRMANIDPLVNVAESIYALGAEKNQRIHLCIYHSQHPLLVRSGIEKRLDRLLNRKKPDAIFKDEEMRDWLDRYAEQDQIFIILATAVAEVGRDHDYDWAIVEPSSMRSIIQLAGRVRRHRDEICETPNIHLLDTNVRHLRDGMAKPAFCRPGFEDKGYLLERHHLTDLLTTAQLARIDASARIRERDPLTPRQNLVDIEHARLRALMLDEKFPDMPSQTSVQAWCNTRANLSGELQRKQRFRKDPQGRRRYGLLPNEDDEIEFCRFEREGGTTLTNKLKHDIQLESGPRINFWGEPDYEVALEVLAESLGMDTAECARKFGVVDLPEKGCEQGWYYHPSLGFSRYI